MALWKGEGLGKKAVQYRGEGSVRHSHNLYSAWECLKSTIGLSYALQLPKSIHGDKNGRGVVYSFLSDIATWQD